MSATNKIRWDNLTLEKAVPVPPPANSGMDILGRMEVDESFAVPKKLYNSLNHAITRYRTRIDKNRRFMIRTVDDNTIRCWRIK